MLRSDRAVEVTFIRCRAGIVELLSVAFKSGGAGVNASASRHFARKCPDVMRDHASSSVQKFSMQFEPASQVRDVTLTSGFVAFRSLCHIYRLSRLIPQIIGLYRVSLFARCLLRPSKRFSASGGNCIPGFIHFGNSRRKAAPSFATSSSSTNGSSCAGAVARNAATH
jgi:hypothetical protein